VPAQATFSTRAALVGQMRVERFPTLETPDRNHQVAAGITNETLHFALMVILLADLVVAYTLKRKPSFQVALSITPAFNSGGILEGYGSSFVDRHTSRSGFP